MAQKYELSEIPPETFNSQTRLTMASQEKKKSGCFISSVVAVVLAFFVIVLVVAVGVIVYFTADKKDIVCNCGDTSGVDSSPDTAAIMQKCVTLATKGDQLICGKCPTATVAPPKPPTTGIGSTATSTVTTTAIPTTVARSTEPTTNPPPKAVNLRLPTALNPIHYDVTMQPYITSSNPYAFTFKGFVRLMLECKSATNNVTLHIKGLTVIESSIKVYGVESDSSDPSYVSWEEDKPKQFFIIHLDKNMEVGKKYMVEMNFTSPMYKDLLGFYYSSYEEGNRTVYLATTQFQPTYARKAFPCMDEPALKATFNMTIVRPAHLMSLSNTIVLDNSTRWTEDGQDYVADVYSQSPKMSPYLVAFIVCEYDYTEGTTKNNITFRAFARPEAKESTRFGLEAGLVINDFFEEYFETPYPLPKQDMAAIPDFFAIGMENWGLITYIEAGLLYEPGVSNEERKDQVALVVSHELAHQWFGNLVTLSWWDDLWLNEGFATFVGFMGVDHLKPKWQNFDHFAKQIHGAFEADDLTSSHPVYVPVNDPDEILEIFDIVSYGKGAAIIRMMRHFLGYETFRRGMKRYIDKTAYDSAFHDDLWSSLTEQAVSEGKNINVKSIMDTWTLQMNYPVVMVTRDFNSVNEINVEQKRYLRDYDAEDPGTYKSSYGYRWTIPLTFTSSRELDFNKTSNDIMWMYKDNARQSFQLNSSQLPAIGDSDGWILANIDLNGFYRVNYQHGNWEALIRKLKTDHTVIPILNRAQLINDAWSLSRSDDLDFDTALKLTDYLKNELDYIPWHTVQSRIRNVNMMLSLSPIYGPFKEFLAAITNKAYNHYGLNNTGSSHNEILLRNIIADFACRVGNENCTTEASIQFRKWMENPQTNKLDSNLRTLIQCHAIRTGGWDEWKFAYEKYREMPQRGPYELHTTLACTRIPWILNTYLHMLTTNQIHWTEGLIVLQLVSRNPYGRSMIWNYFRENYDRLEIIYGRYPDWLTTIATITESFNTDLELNQILSLVESKEGMLAPSKRSLQSAVEKTKSNIKWMKKNQPIIRKWLNDQGYN